VRGRQVAKWIGLGITASLGGLYAVYRYQPQRYALVERKLPDENPPVDPDSKHLFSPEARVAVVVAHPDDPEFYIGGFLTKLGQAGAKILIVMCTDGDKGYYPRFLTDPAENRRVRRLEQIEAAKQYGATVVFLGKPDGRLVGDAQTTLEVVRELEKFKPDYVVSFDPYYRPRLQHSDHVQAGAAASKAIFAVSGVKWLMRFSTRAANWFTDITPLWSQKRELLAVHKSQFYGDKFEFIANMVKARAKADGEKAGVLYAEGFRCFALPTEPDDSVEPVKPKPRKRKPKA
jgi:LmbE family N-acetylglucosaminyl deacetylase